MSAVQVTEPGTGQWDTAQRDEVLWLAQAATETDGVAPLSEAFLLRLRHDRPDTRHFAARQDGTLLGYAQLHTTSGEAELVVHPAYRHRGIGRALLTALLEHADGPAAVTSAEAPGGLKIWAHGDHPSATALGWSAGFRRDRTLWQLRRDLVEPVPAPTLPDGIRLRAYRPGADDEAWLRVNGRAFRDHPDQGRWTLDDLQVRQREAWFDPAGFLIAEDPDGRILGFHWTKVHDDGTRRTGEVYVLGVDPDAQGTGLGGALTTAGLRHLQQNGLRQVMLYVDEDNPRAVALYRRLGFTQWLTDVEFAM